MELKLLESSSDTAKVEVRGESSTLTQLIADAAWDEGIDAAAIQEHPFMAEPKIVVRGERPLAALEKAAAAVIKRCEAFKEAFSKALEK